MQNYEGDDKYTYKIIGCAMAVHTTVGAGFQEVIYQRALELELEWHGINVRREAEIPIHYKESWIGTRRADFLIEERILVEIKAVVKMEKVHFAQILNYLSAYDLDTGLLLNFGTPKLQYKRFYRKPKMEL